MLKKRKKEDEKLEGSYQKVKSNAHAQNTLLLGRNFKELCLSTYMPTLPDYPEVSWKWYTDPPLSRTGHQISHG